MNLQKLKNGVLEIEDEILRIRRQIHEYLEFSYKEYNTAKLVSEVLKKLGIEVRTGVGLPTVVVGILKTSKPER
jgi:metal-dependent amidase/aminoacylase/carboxypeptidase family protein